MKLISGHFRVRDYKTKSEFCQSYSHVIPEKFLNESVAILQTLLPTKYKNFIINGSDACDFSVIPHQWSSFQLHSLVGPDDILRPNKIIADHCVSADIINIITPNMMHEYFIPNWSMPAESINFIKNNYNKIREDAIIYSILK